MKICSKCSEEKPLESFHRRGKSTQPQCKVCKAKYGALRYEKRKDHILSKNRDWAERNADYKKELNSSWKRRNPAKVNQATARRRTLKLKATPAWLTDQHLAEIEYLYSLARELKTLTGESYHVDHIVPLKGKTVSGLHVPWNLQVLPADINCKKGALGWE